MTEFAMHSLYNLYNRGRNSMYRYGSMEFRGHLATRLEEVSPIRPPTLVHGAILVRIRTRYKCRGD